MNGQLGRKIKRELTADPARAWREPIVTIAETLSRKRGRDELRIHAPRSFDPCEFLPHRLWPRTTIPAG